MTRAAPAIYCDEDVHGAVWRGMVRLGIDASSVISEGRQGDTDEDHLAFALSVGRVILTHNVEDFPRLHHHFLAAGRHHAGIIVCRQDLSIGQIIRRAARLCAALSAEEMRDRLEYLGSWSG